MKLIVSVTDRKKKEKRRRKIPPHIISFDDDDLRDQSTSTPSPVIPSFCSAPPTCLNSPTSLTSPAGNQLQDRKLSSHVQNSVSEQHQDDEEVGQTKYLAGGRGNVSSEVGPSPQSTSVFRYMEAEQAEEVIAKEENGLNDGYEKSDDTEVVEAEEETEDDDDQELLKTSNIRRSDSRPSQLSLRENFNADSSKVYCEGKNIPLSQDDGLKENWISEDVRWGRESEENLSFTASVYSHTSSNSGSNEIR